MKALFVTVAAALLAVPCFAQRSTPMQLVHPSGAAGDQLGEAVAISGDTLIVGTKLAKIGTNAGQGSAQIYRWTGTTWVFEASLTASDGATGDSFGQSVAVSGDTAIVGAWLDDVGPNSSQGSAYVFTRAGSDWTQQAKLVASHGAANDNFGFCVAISGDTAVVGASLTDVGANNNQGAAYVFARLGSAWIQQAQLVDPDGEAEDQFGCAVSLSGETVLVGGFRDDVGANIDQGAASVFVRLGATWTRQAKLLALDGAFGDSFGYSVALSGDTALVGAYLDDVLVVNMGSAYVFTRIGSTWTQQAKLFSPNLGSDYFGYSVALSGNTALVGAPYDDAGGNVDRGSGYFYTRAGSTWTLQASVSDPDGAAFEYFGCAVGLSGDLAVAGAFRDDVGANADQGSAWVFSRIGDNWIAPDTQILASNGAATDFFGMSVSVAGDYAVVGAGSRVVGANSNQGVAYVYLRSGHQWIQQAQLVASDGAAGDNFGQSVSISGDTIVVGADRNDHGGAGNAERGAAYVFTRSDTSWFQQAKLIASDAADNDQFGYSVAVDGSTAVIGSYLNDVGANANQGSAYVYIRNGSTWTQQANLTAGAGAPNDQFGFSVAIYGNTALVGAHRANVGPNADQGAAYVFTRSGSSWSQQATLAASDGAASNYFGGSVSLSGETALIGAFAAAVNGQNASGAAYTFTRSGSAWSQQQKLVPPSPAANDNFGKSLAIADDTALIGAPLADIAGVVNQGAAYIFTRVGSLWNRHEVIVDPTGAAGDAFGTAIGLSGGVAFVSSQNDTVGANANQGSARALDVPYDDFRGVYDESVGNGWLTFSEAIPPAAPQNSLLGTETAFRFGGSANTGPKTLAIHCSADIHAPVERILSLGDSSFLFVPLGRTISIFGPLSSYPAAAITVSGDSFLLGSRGSLTARAASSIAINSPVSSLEGLTTVEAGSSLSFSGSMQNIGPVTALTGSSLSAGGTITNIDLTLLTNAAITAPLYFNRASVLIDGACSVTGAFANNDDAITLLNSGSLDISGTCTNSGILAAAAQPPNLTVGASLVQSTSAGFIMPFSASLVRVGGDFDAAINSNAAFALSLATLRLDGSSPEQTMEAMSKDIGPDASGLNRALPGHFPIGTLEIASTVRLVDNHDNDTLGQGTCEAIYVNELRINSGSHLINTGCAKIYYNTLVNDGTVDVPANLIPIGTLPCPGDLNGDTQVDDSDFVFFAAAYNILDCADPAMPPACPADLTGDGFVDDADFVLFAAAYNALVCP